MEVAFKVVRDLFVFTDKRLILVDKQGLTSRKVDYLVVPYRAITSYSIETAGTLDMDLELKIWTSGRAEPIQNDAQARRKHSRDSGCHRRGSMKVTGLGAVSGPHPGGPTLQALFRPPVAETVAPARALFWEGEAAGYVFLVLKGCLRLYRIVQDGRRAIFGFSYPGDLLGVTSCEIHTFTAEPVTSSGSDGLLAPSMISSMTARISARNVSLRSVANEAAQNDHAPWSDGCPRARRHLPPRWRAANRCRRGSAVGIGLPSGASTLLTTSA